MRAARAYALLGAVELILFLLAVLPFLRHNGLTEHDLIGHRAAAAWSAEVLWPRPRGWDPRFFCGAPFGIAYPPALAWLAGGAARLIGVDAALKLWVALGVVATPAAIYLGLRAVASRPAAIAAALAGTLYLALRSAELGGNFQATFQTGNLAEALALPLFFLYLAALPSLLRGHALPAALLLAAILVTHLVTGLIALVLCAAVVVVAPRRAVVAHAACAFLLTAFFTVPLVLERGFGAQPLVSYDQYPDLAFETLLSITLFAAAAFALLGDRRVERRVAVAALGAAALVFVLRGFVFSDPPAGGWHLHRFKLFDQLLVLVLAIALLGDRLPSLRRLGPALALAGLVLLAWACARLPTRGVPPQPFPTAALARAVADRPGRVLVVASPAHQRSDHVVQHLAAFAGAKVGKGLFIESAAQGPLLVELERLYASAPVRAWGVLLAQPEELRRLEPRRDALLLHLGFSSILSNEPLRSPPTPARSIGEGFSLTDLPEVEDRGALAVAWREPLQPTRDEREAYLDARGRFLGTGGALPFRGHGRLPPPALAPAPADAHVTTRESGDGQGIDLAIDPGAAGQPIPVLVRTSYHPGWQARDGSGAQLPIYEAAPHLMLIFAQGPVQLRFGYSPIERWARKASLAGLVLLIALALASWRLARR